MPALIVSIEGTDFSGKSTIANLLIEILRKNNKDIIIKRTGVPSELNTGFFSKILRNSTDKVSSEVFSLVYATDHLHLYETIIKPLKESKENFLIIQERSLLSTYIYQSIIGNVDLKWIREINKFAKTIPDMTLVIKLDLDELRKRSALEKKEFDKFETEKHLEEEVKVYYNLPEELMKEFNVEYIEGRNNPEKIAELCAERIQKKIDNFFS